MISWGLKEINFRTALMIINSTNLREITHAPIFYTVCYQQLFITNIKKQNMKSNFRIGQVVKYSNPQPGEEDLRFYVNEIHEPCGNLKEKLHVELICNDFIKPTFCHFSEEYEPSYFTETVEYNGKMVQCENFGRIV